MTIVFVAIAVAGGLTEARAQASLEVSATVPAYINTGGLDSEATRYMEHDMAVQVPLGSGTVQVRAGFAVGDTSLMVRDFALGTHVWADSTRVVPSGSGHLLTFGRYTGLDAVYVELRQGGSTIGSGYWLRP